MTGRCAKRLKAGAHSLNQRVKIAAIALDKGGVFILLGFSMDIFNFQINDFNRLVFIADSRQITSVSGNSPIYPWQCQ